MSWRVEMKIYERMKSLSPEDKVDTLARILEHQSRRMHKTVTYGSPVIPVDGYLESGNGVVLRHMVGLNCKLIGGIIFLETCEESVTATVRFYSQKQNFAFDVNLEKGLTALSHPTDLAVGTRIVISVISSKPDKLFGVWAALVLKPVLPKEAVEQILIDNLLKEPIDETNQNT
jgi:hypothetical protein